MTLKKIVLQGNLVFFMNLYTLQYGLSKTSHESSGVSFPLEKEVPVGHRIFLLGIAKNMVSHKKQKRPLLTNSFLFNSLHVY